MHSISNRNFEIHIFALLTFREKFQDVTPGKANVVADALSRKVHCNYLTVELYSETLCEDLRKLRLEIVEQGNLNAISAESCNTLKFSDFRMLIGRIIKQRFLIILKFSEHLCSLQEI
jgi:hypothetical protein